MASSCANNIKENRLSFLKIVHASLSLCAQSAGTAFVDLSKLVACEMNPQIKAFNPCCRRNLCLVCVQQSPRVGRHEDWRAAGPPLVQHAGFGGLSPRLQRRSACLQHAPNGRIPVLRLPVVYSQYRSRICSQRVFSNNPRTTFAASYPLNTWWTRPPPSSPKAKANYTTDSHARLWPLKDRVLFFKQVHVPDKIILNGLDAIRHM
jgi:hypothetical protein